MNAGALKVDGIFWF